MGVRGGNQLVLGNDKVDNAASPDPIIARLPL